MESKKGGHTIFRRTENWFLLFLVSAEFGGLDTCLGQFSGLEGSCLESFQRFERFLGVGLDVHFVGLSLFLSR